MFFRRVASPGADPGRWVKHWNEDPPGPGESEPKKVLTGIEFKVRPIPAGKKMEIDRRHRGASRKVKLFRTGDSEITRDLDKELIVGIEQAVFALVDSKGCKVQIVDEAAAVLYRKFLKDESIAVGQMVTLDGRWTDDLREDFLSVEVDVAAWIVARADEQSGAVAEEDAGKEKTSSTTPSSV